MMPFVKLDLQCAPPPTPQDFNLKKYEYALSEVAFLMIKVCWSNLISILYSLIKPKIVLLSMCITINIEEVFPLI